MIPTNINHYHLLKAIKEIDKDGIPSHQDSSKYDLLYERKRYPIKLVVRIANEFANGDKLWGFGGGLETNSFMESKGFIIVGKDKIPVDNFFNVNEIEYYDNIAGESYDKNNLSHKVLLHLLKYSLRPKTNYWGEQVTPSGFIFNGKSHPLQRAYREMRIRPYTWASIQREKDKEKYIYFTVGVITSKDPNSGSQSALVYKLDCQSESYTNLTENQINRFYEITKSEKVDWKVVNLNQLTTYTWNKLIKETKSFFENNIQIYEDVIKEIWSGKKFSFTKPKKEFKICRICWNTNGWTSPSGRQGKAPTDSHEKRYGFGHEEWLFDTSRIIDGYQYGFLEPIRNVQETYKGRKFQLFLYSRDSRKKQNFWIGQLNDVEVISKEDAAIIIDKYKTKGLLDIMKIQLEEVGLDGNKIENEYLNENDIINIRFRKNEIQNIFENPIQVEEEDKRISSPRYALLPWDGINNIDPPEEEDYFNTGNSGNGKLKSKARATHHSGTKEIELTHNLISDSFLEYLKKEKGQNKVKRECRVVGNNRIDIVAREEDGDIFYEIKTYPFLKTCLRYALGQLIEYSCYPEKNRAKKFYLVSDIEADDKFEKYIKHLNKSFSFNLGYICYSIDRKEITQQI